MNKNKEIVFCIFKYFQFGGLQRDFLRTAIECQKRGFKIVVYTNEWTGDIPNGFEIRIIKKKHLVNHKNALQFSTYINEEIISGKINFVVSFNRINNPDVYFAGDNCLKEKILTEKSFFYRFMPRNKIFCSLEKGIFSPLSKTHIMYLTDRQKLNYIKYYGTKNERFHLLPPGISEDRKRPSSAIEIKDSKRDELGISKNSLVVIQIGSGFRTKGVDRSIIGIASLSKELLDKVVFLVIGNDNKKQFVKLAQKLGVNEKIKFLGGRTDVTDLILAADLMIHPAINEATGTVLVEALAEGLPVLCSEACGYSNLVNNSGAGIVIAEPFSQEKFNIELSHMLTDKKLEEKGLLGCKYADKENFYNRQIVAADIIESMYIIKSF